MGLTSYVIRRILILFPMVIGVTLLTFVIAHLVPVDPVAAIVGEKGLQNPEIVRAATEKWGLDKPLAVQYLVYLHNLLKGDLGTSFKNQRPVARDLALFWPASLELAACSFAFAVLAGLPMGIVAAVKAGSWVDHVVRFFSLLGASVPPFWSGLVGLFLFWFKIPIFAGPGRLDVRVPPPPSVTSLYLVDSLLARDLATFVNALRHILLPSIILGWFTLAMVARITRSSLVEVLRTDYVRTARAKGLRESTVVLRHALGNAMIPTLTTLGLAIAGLMTGAIMTETIFGWPGVGRYCVEAAASLDYPVVISTTLVFALIFLIANLVVDILYAFADPRIREV